MQTATAVTQSRNPGSRWLAWTILSVCGAWLVVTGALWLVTGTSLPTINVRWGPSVTADQRVQLEQELSLVLHEPGNERTGRYFVTRSDAETLKRIVVHPLVEDTAFVSRSTFVLEGAPYVRTWIGDRMTLLKQPSLWLLGLLGVLASAATLVWSRISRRPARA